MRKKTPEPKTAGNTNVARTTAKTNTADAPVFHVGLDVHAADFTAAISEPQK